VTNTVYPTTAMPSQLGLTMSPTLSYTLSTSENEIETISMTISGIL